MNTETTVSTLQERLNVRAENRMNQDLLLMRNAYSSLPDLIKVYLDSIWVDMGTEEKPETTRLGNIISNNSSIFEKHFKIANSEKYQQKETDNFMAQVDSLQSQIDDLQH